MTEVHRYDETVEEEILYSNAQPIWHFIALTLVSCGLYQLVWFYRTWKQLQNHHDWQLSYVNRTVFTFIPLVGCFITANLFYRIERLLKQRNIRLKLVPLLTMLVYYGLNLLFQLPGLYWLLGFLSTAPLLYVQFALNAYWRQVQPDLSVRTEFSKRQQVLIVSGLFCWVFICLAMFLG